jgi:hypothetical protein
MARQESIIKSLENLSKPALAASESAANLELQLHDK